MRKHKENRIKSIEKRIAAVIVIAAVLFSAAPQVYADDVSGTDSGQQAAMSSEYDTTLDDPTDITKSLTKSDTSTGDYKVDLTVNGKTDTSKKQQILICIDNSNSMGWKLTTLRRDGDTWSKTDWDNDGVGDGWKPDPYNGQTLSSLGTSGYYSYNNGYAQMYLGYQEDSARLTLVKNALLGDKDASGNYVGNGLIDELFEEVPNAEITVMTMGGRETAQYNIYNGQKLSTKKQVNDAAGAELTDIQGCGSDQISKIRSGIADIPLAWQKYSTFATGWYGNKYVNNFCANGGTEYSAAMTQASSALQSMRASDSTAEQTFIFMSDGVPNEVNQNQGIRGFTKSMSDAVRSANPGVTCYSIAYSQDATDSMATQALTWVAGDSSRLYKATGTDTGEEELIAAFKAIFHKVAEKNSMSDVTVTDPLSSWVNYTGTSIRDSDLSVWITTETGSTRKLTEGTDYTITEASSRSGTVKYLGVLGEGATLHIEFTVKADPAYVDYFNNGTNTENANNTYPSNAQATASGLYKNQTYTGIYHDPNLAVPAASLTMKKTDQAGSLMSGVQFTLTDGDQRTAVKTTGSDGKIEFSRLTPGTYTLTETLPEGYAKPGGYDHLLIEVIERGSQNDTNQKADYDPDWIEDPMTPNKLAVRITVVTADGTTGTNLSDYGISAGGLSYDQNLEMTVTNRSLKVSPKLQKIGEGDTAQLLGEAEYSVYQSWSDAVNDRNVQAVVTTKTDAPVELPEYQIGDSIFVRETEAPAGYDLDPSVYKVTFGDGSNTIIKASGENTGEAPASGDYPAVTQDQAPVITFDDTKTVLPLLLVKEDGTSGVQIDGAEFTIYSDAEMSLPVETVTSRTGGALLSGVYTQDTTYYIRETKAPTGYKLNQAAFRFSYTLTGAEPKFEIEPVSGTGTVLGSPTLAAEDGRLVMTFPNFHQSVIPAAGGEGLLGFMITGTLILISMLYYKAFVVDRRGPGREDG